MYTRMVRTILALVFAVFGVTAAYAQINVTQRNYDAGQTGWNSAETVLTPSNVNSTLFGRLFNVSVDDHIYAQPLYVHGLTVGGATHNVVFVATVNNSVYAFDADNGGNPLWSRNFGTPVNHTQVGSACGTYLDYTGNAGLVGTPVIDTASNTIYFVTHTVISGTHTQTLHAIDITTGADRATNASVVISASGFSAATQNQRAGLILLNGTVYIAESSYCDTTPYHGFLFGYTASTLAQVGVFDVASGGSQDAIWMSGGAPATDGTSIYFLTANGSWNGTTQFGESIVKVNQSLGLVDWFTPDNWSALNGNDLDVSTGRGTLIPGKNLLVGGGKNATVYLVNTTNLGHEVSGNGQIVQLFSAGGGEIHGSAFANNVFYLWQVGANLKAFAFNGTTFNTTPTSTSSMIAQHPGGNLTVSSNGASNGIVWALTADNPTEHADSTGELRAFNATNLATELYDTNMNSGRDSLGGYPKFNPPIVANGKVYAPTATGTLNVYGIIPTNCTPPSAPSGLAGTTVSGNQINLSWTASTTPTGCAVGYSVYRSTTSGFTPSTSNQIASSIFATTYSDTLGVPNTTYFYLVEGVNPGGSSGPSNQAQATTGPPITNITINSGGPLVSPFVADEDFSGGATLNHPNTIDLTGVTNPAPMAVYQTARDSNFSYTIPGFAPGSSQKVRLHFAETFWNAAGKRTFNVIINGTQVLTAFDVWVAAGNKQNKAVIQEFTENANSSGQYVLTFTNVVDNSMVSGIEIVPTAACAAAPPAPTGLGATAASSSQINLSWTASAPPTGCSVTYTIFRSTTSGFTPSSSNQIATGVTTTTYSNTGLAASTTYYYLVEASDSFGTSAASNQASATTPASCTAVPPAPTGLGATAASSSQINLSWTASAPPTGCTVSYTVYRSTTNGFTPSSSNQIATGVSGTSFSDTGLAASTTYYYLVEAVDAAGSSAASNQASATTPTGCTPPAAPTGLSATGTGPVSLSWTASAVPAGCASVTYTVFRSTTSGFTPSSSNQIASGVTATTYSDTTAACGTTYFYLVEAADSAGSSGASNQTSATTSACPTGPRINSGGPAVSPFVADVDFVGGSTINHPNTIDLSGVTNPAPMAVYQTARVGTSTYTIPGFTAGSSHTVRLHFAETYFAAAGSRTFNVSINGTQVLAAFDIFKTAGAKNKAVIEQFTENANSSGQYVIAFTNVVNLALISGIEVQ